jgi:hypothetical protein
MAARPRLASGCIRPGTVRAAQSAVPATSGGASGYKASPRAFTYQRLDRKILSIRKGVILRGQRMRRLDRARRNAGEFEPVDFSNLYHGADYSGERARCETLGQTTKAVHFVKCRQKVRVTNRARACRWSTSAPFNDGRRLRLCGPRTARRLHRA